MKRFYALICILSPILLLSQTLPDQNSFEWPDRFVSYQAIPDSLKDEEIIILKEDIVLNEIEIQKRVAVLIQRPEGLNYFKKLLLPENFDVTNFPNIKKQGRFSDKKNPYMENFKPQFFAARIIKPGKKIIEIPLKFKVSNVYSIIDHGRRVKDFVYEFDIDGIETGDILEYTYKAEIKWYQQQVNIFPNSIFPKLKYNLTIELSIQNELKDIELIYNSNINEANIEKYSEFKTGHILKTYKYKFNFLEGINYPLNCIAGATLPNIAINNKRYYELPGSSGSGWVATNIDVYKWSVHSDTIRKPIYDKYHANIRKFITKFRDDPSDSSGNSFACELTDSLNTMKFLSTESLNYGDIPQYAMYSSEQLLKGKIVEEFMFKNYCDIISEKGLFYYVGIVVDKRYSLLIPEYRKNVNMERTLVVIPEKRSFKYYMPRYDGIKYNPDEFPFYYEGTNCALMPCSNCNVKSSQLNLLFLRSPKSSFNENSRSESGVFKVVTDSFKIKCSVKESLAGQFSTTLRHYYNNEHIDSTINLHYFKKCVDKPHSGNVQVKKGSESKKYPFRTSYSASMEIKQASAVFIDMLDWFSFVYRKLDYKTKPSKDFYVDFQFSDTYNFLFEFDKPTEILNTEAFGKKLSNAYFEISSNLVKQESNKYLLSVIVKVKQDMIPEKDGDKIVEFVNILDEINRFKLNYKVL